MNYKYSIDGFDDEAGPQTNHVRLIRTYGTNYIFPNDAWTWSLPQSTVLVAGSNGIVEKDFGNLNATAPVSGKIPVTWLGRPGVVLQNRSSLTGGAWTDNAATDSTMSTNWPNTGPAQFFRLKKQ